jgi:asparagine synthase (glutamine-hydrolysing)
MCGITGILDPRATRQRLQQSASALGHRGPDGTGIYLDADRGLGLAHARLAVIDLVHGAQPLLSADQQIVLVCNGEIYDFERQRRGLERDGHRFLTNSDSEIIIHLYQEYGLRFTDHLRGEFAFLLLDRAHRRLVAVRDRFGIKPLYVAGTDRNGWIFSSEIKGIFATSLVRPRIDPQEHLFGDELATPFRTVRHIAPATAMLVDLDSGTREDLTYWKPNLPSLRDAEPRRPLVEYVEQTDHLLTEAVRLRMRADVPVGVYLSGGLDSAVVSAKIVEMGGTPPKAFTVAFTDQGEEHNELRQSRVIARHLGLDQHVVEVGPRQLWDNLEGCLWHTEAPIGNLAPVGKYLLSALARRHVMVVLTGEGADEVFLGYHWFRRASTLMGRASMWMDTQVHDLRNQLFTRLIGLRGDLPAASSPGGGQAADRSQLAGRHPVVQLQYRRLKEHLLPVILSAYGDRTEMAHSIEGRTPFLDHHLFEFARNIPVDLNICHGMEKCVLRHLARGLVPDEIVKRRKWPFSTPAAMIGAEAHDAARRTLSTYLTRDAIGRTGLFNWEGVALLGSLRKIPRLRRTLDKARFYVCNMQILHRLFVENAATPATDVL